MATDYATIYFDSTTDEAFRLWGSRISQALSACGLIKTADTGQINWTSVARPVDTSVGEKIIGYEMWRFDDALQATLPVFIKVEYGAGKWYNATRVTQNYNVPVIFVTIGTATDGAGNLTGTLTSSRFRVGGGSIYSTNTTSTAGEGTAGKPTGGAQPCYFSGDKSSIQFCLGAQDQAQPTWQTVAGYTQHGTTPYFLGIERTRDALGAATGDGVYIVVNVWYNTTSTAAPTVPAPGFQVVSFHAGFTVTPNIGYWPIAYSGPGFGTANFQNDVYFTPMSIASPKPAAPALGWLGTWKTDVTLGSTQVVNINGATHTYVSLAGIAGTATNDNARSHTWSSIPQGAVMMRYE